MSKTIPAKKKYYYTSDANLPLAHGNFTFNFRRVQFSNCVWAGIYETDEPEKQAALDALMQVQSAVCEVPKEFYDDQLVNMDDSAMRPVDKTPTKIIPEGLIEANIMPEGVDDVSLEVTDAPKDTTQKRKPRKAKSATPKKETPAPEPEPSQHSEDTDLEIDDL